MIERATPKTHPARRLGWPISCLFFAALALWMAPSCAAGGSGESGEVGGKGGSLGLDAGSGGSALNPDAACGAASDEATLVPLNMFVTVDKSMSMALMWGDTTSALQTFFGASESAGLRVAMCFFPDTGCDSDCNVGACAQPKVPLGELTSLSAPDDPHEQALLDGFVGVDVGGGNTPLSAALEGALLWAGNHLTAHPTEKAAVVLVTDGEPEACNQDHNYLIGLARNAYTTSGVLTFAIGLPGSNESLMNQIAAEGGTSAAVMVGSENTQTELLAAFDAIRGSTVACEFIVPDEIEGQEVDPGLVNVFHTPGGGGEAQLIGQVDSAAACVVGTPGWYYDDPLNPTRVIFCADTCATIRGDADAKIDVLFGCTTVPA